MKRYGQYCPVSRAAEVLAERWTLLVVREMLWGNDRFSAIARGVPRISPTLLSARLRELERAGIVVRRGEGAEARYGLTEAGRELEPVLVLLGSWAQRWMHELRPDDLDLSLLMLDIGRTVTLRGDGLPSRPVAVHVELSDVSAHERSWWWTFSARGMDVCDVDPGHEVRAWLRTGLRTLTELWLGDARWDDARRRELVALHGDRGVCRSLPGWLGTGVFGEVERVPVSLPRTGV